MEIFATCHVHSTWSYDGKWTLEALSAKFGRRGCRVLMMTEHDRGFTAARLDEYRRACAQASSSEILVVPGIEYSDAANRVHVLVWGPVPFLGESLPTGQMLDAVHKAGGLAVLAHPSRREAWKSFEPAWAERLLGIEAWNRKYDGWAPSRTAGALLHDAGAIPFVGLDFHTQRQSFPLTMALEMEGNVGEENVLDCLRARRCYARAFGFPLSESVVRTALPVLSMAEQSRRMMASIARRSGVISR
jgi:hypothetical protein